MTAEYCPCTFDICTDPWCDEKNCAIERHVSTPHQDKVMERMGEYGDEDDKRVEELATALANDDGMRDDYIPFWERELNKKYPPVPPDDDMPPAWMFDLDRIIMDWKIGKTSELTTLALLWESKTIPDVEKETWRLNIKSDEAMACTGC